MHPMPILIETTGAPKTLKKMTSQSRHKVKLVKGAKSGMLMC